VVFSSLPNEPKRMQDNLAPTIERLCAGMARPSPSGCSSTSRDSEVAELLFSKGMMDETTRNVTSTGDSEPSSGENSTGSNRWRRQKFSAIRAKLEREGGISSTTLRKGKAFLVGLVVARVRLRGVSGRGKGVRVNGGLVVTNDGKMLIGSGSVLRGIPTSVELATGPVGSLTIGEGAIINSGASICAYGNMTVGNRVLIGPYVMINDTSFHDLYERSVVPEPLDVVIEDDVWIGAKASILPGVRIGRGAVVSAHSLVNRDVDAFTIVSGVPAVQIAKLNPKKFVVRDPHTGETQGQA
jgi:carbonic anhydrase/acetyltransferase-like protein (isoleucine patch superfamily)